MYEGPGIGKFTEVENRIKAGRGGRNWGLLLKRYLLFGVLSSGSGQWWLAVQSCKCRVTELYT